MGDEVRKPVDIYARLSRALDGSWINVDEQEDLGRADLDRRGVPVGRVFKDNSKSAWNPNVVRPDWNLLMHRLESGASGGVWVLDLTRWTRKVLEGERLLELARSGIRVLSNSGEYDLTTADGRKAFRDAITTAAAESDKISERSRRGKARRAKKGRLNGGVRGFGMPGFYPKPEGWEPGDPREPVPAEVVEAEREIVRECYRRLLAGEPLYRLVRELNTRRVVTSKGYARWYAVTLASSLQRAALAGLVERNGEVVGTAVDVEPVVTREEWERLRALFAARRRGRPVDRHFLSGLVRCGTCGNVLYGQRRKTQPPYPDGAVRRVYYCLARPETPNACGRNTFDARTLEAAVAHAVKTRLGDPRRADRIAAKLATAREERGRIEAEISFLNEEADKLAGKVAEWGVDRVDAQMSPLLRRIDERKSALARLEEPEDAGAAAADAARAWDEAVAADDMKTLRAMVKRAYPRLTLRPRDYYFDNRVERIDYTGKSLPNLAGN
jgi:DNA invertase Pin-like site-specific DNA recombinase